MNRHCHYCGREIAEEHFCCEACAEKYEQATSGQLHNPKYFLLGLALSLFVIIWGPITRNEQMVGVGIAMLGFVVAKWPLTTPEMVQRLGYLMSHEICRAIGVSVIPLGLITALFM